MNIPLIDIQDSHHPKGVMCVDCLDGEFNAPNYIRAMFRQNFPSIHRILQST